MDIMKKQSIPNMYNNLSDFLKHHQTVKSDATKSEKSESPTHTRIGNSKLNVHGGSYNIPKEDIHEFMKLYHKSVFIDKNLEYLTEKQLNTNGGILVDIDLRYEHSVVERIHTKEHIVDLIVLCLDELKTMLVFTEDTSFPVYIFEKPLVNRLTDGSLTKDGIHMIIGIQMDHISQMILRDNIVKKVEEIWGDLPIINKWDNVFDDGITKGTTNWQMFGSRKPGYLAYELTQYYEITFDISDKELMMNELSVNTIISPDKLAANLYKLSAQYDEHQIFEYTEEMQKILEMNKSKLRKKNTKTKVKLLIDSSNDNDVIEDIQIDDIVDEITLKKAVDNMLNGLSVEEYYIREAHEYTQILPARFYQPGSHAMNTQVALALKHTDVKDRLFLSWVMLRSKADDFEYSTITELHTRWIKHFKDKPDGGVTIRSIMYWAKEGSKEDYDRVKKGSCEHYIEQTVINPNDFDFAKVLYHMYKDKYVCSENKTWFVFKNHRWELDKGTTLRMMISTEMYALYEKKLQKIISETMELESTDPRLVAINKKINKLKDVAVLLKKTSEKNNIMVEAREIFYDAEFSKKIDTNRWLICFKNGVVDLKQRIFRNGLPSDYITKCTNIIYEEYDESNKEQSIIAEEIYTFMRQLFPEDNLYEYMWNHLSSVLIGENTNQTFNIYHGRGSNGKSMLTDLMFMTLGEYAGSVPVTLITEKRQSIGATSSEIMQLKGVRYAVMAEPKKGEPINEGIMKQLTGDSTMSARALYCETETFTIQFHLVVCTNTLFEMNSHDDGTWRRIRVCDFKAKFTEPDEYFRKETYPYQFPKNKNLKDKMQNWISIFAGMLVKHAFKTQGIYENCQSVKERTLKYRRESDYISCFVSEKIRLVNPDDTSIILKPYNVSQEFKIWYNSAAPGNKAPKLAEIKEFITNKFYEQSKQHGGWIGMKILNGNETDTDTSDNCGSNNITATNTVITNPLELIGT